MIFLPLHQRATLHKWRHKFKGPLWCLLMPMVCHLQVTLLSLAYKIEEDENPQIKVVSSLLGQRKISSFLQLRETSIWRQRNSTKAKVGQSRILKPPVQRERKHLRGAGSWAVWATMLKVQPVENGEGASRSMEPYPQASRPCLQQGNFQIRKELSPRWTMHVLSRMGASEQFPWPSSSGNIRGRNRMVKIQVCSDLN